MCAVLIKDTHRSPSRCCARLIESVRSAALRSGLASAASLITVALHLRPLLFHLLHKLRLAPHSTLFSSGWSKSSGLK